MPLCSSVRAAHMQVCMLVLTTNTDHRHADDDSLSLSPLAIGDVMQPVCMVPHCGAVRQAPKCCSVRPSCSMKASFAGMSCVRATALQLSAHSNTALHRALQSWRLAVAGVVEWIRQQCCLCYTNLNRTSSDAQVAAGCHAGRCGMGRTPAC